MHCEISHFALELHNTFAIIYSEILLYPHTLNIFFININNKSRTFMGINLISNNKSNEIFEKKKMTAKTMQFI